MLQRNAPAARQAHLAHAALLGLHTLCCGLPALALLAAALSGATAGISLLSDTLGIFHEILHAHEIWIVLISAALAGVGGALELHARRAGHRLGFPWLFAVSVLCFVANVGVILAHRG